MQNYPKGASSHPQKESGEITRQLVKIKTGDKDAYEKLYAIVYNQLRDIAAMLNISVRTVHRDWAKARAWLYRKLSS